MTVDAFNIDQTTIMPGLKPVLEMLENEPEKIFKIFVKPDFFARNDKIRSLCIKNKIRYMEIPPSKLDALANNSTHQGIIAEVSGITYLTPHELYEKINSAPVGLIIALDQIQDPGNLGAIARTAYALGSAGLLITKHNSAAVGPGALKASAGALKKISLAMAVNLAKALDMAEEQGITIYGAESESYLKKINAAKSEAVNIFSLHWDLPAILVLGNEEKGIRPGVAKRCSKILTIDFARKFDSLNIAQAAAICLALCVNFLKKRE